MNLRYSPRGQLLTITRDGVVHSTHYDGLGRAVELGYSDGTRYQASMRLGYDDAGPEHLNCLGGGYDSELALDTEGQSWNAPRFRAPLGIPSATTTITFSRPK